jgi:putative DNA primase/helicase
MQRLLARRMPHLSTHRRPDRSRHHYLGGDPMMLDQRTVASALGGDVIGRDGVSAPGPGHNKIDRSLSIKLDSRARDGFVVFSHSGDDPIKCRDYVRERLGLGPWEPKPKDDPIGRMAARVSRDYRQRELERGKGPPKAIDPGPDPEKEKRKAWALRIWSQSINPIGSIVERYLREHRGLELSDDIAGNVIRFHGSLRFDEFDRRPGMVCLLRDIVTDEPCGIHRTFLDRATAQKIDRRMLGIAKHAAIKLDAHATISTTLTIGEGVETALSGRMAGLGPVWALGSSGAVGAFPVIRGVTEITILEENDPTSCRDVKTCAHRYLAARKPVNIVTTDIGNDLNDAWRSMQ